MNGTLGIDKSSYDGHGDWALAFQHGIRFATIRASLGDTSDPLHQSEADKAKAAGVLVSPYHWYVPRINPVKQAQRFLSSTKGGTLRPMIDLEDYGTTKAYAGIWKDELRPWLQYVESAVGVRPMLYSSPGYIAAYLLKDTEIVEYEWVLAHYDVAAPYPQKPLTPLDIAAWQFGDGRDGHYYGLPEAWGCALYVSDRFDAPVEWVSAAVVPSEPPVTPPAGYTKATALMNVTVRGGPAKTFAPVFPWLFLAGQTRDALDVVQENGNTWVEISQGQWCAAVYAGATLIKLS